MTPIQRIRVPAGFAFALIYLYWSQPQQPFILVGFSLALLGLLFRLWAAGHIEKGKRLTSSGPYLRTRNPLYFGSFLIGLGFAVASATIGLVVLFLCLFLAVYGPVMLREEEELKQAFGFRYQSYRGRVPRFVPRLVLGEIAPDGDLSCNFRWQRVILNREYRTIGGFLVMAALVVAKMLWI